MNYNDILDDFIEYQEILVAIVTTMIENTPQFIDGWEMISMDMYRKRPLFVYWCIFVCLTIVTIIYYFVIYNNKKNVNRNFLKKIETGITAIEYGINNGDELVEFLENNAHKINLPMNIEKLINFKKWKSHYYADLVLKDEINNIKHYAYYYLIQKLALDSYNSEAYPITTNYKNKFKSKSFLKEVPVFDNKELNIGCSVEDGIIEYSYGILQSKLTGKEKVLYDQRCYKAYYGMIINEKGYIDDIIFKGVYQVMDKNGNIIGSGDGKRVRYISFQTEEAKQCIKDLLSNVKLMLNTIKNQEKALSNNTDVVKKYFTDFFAEYRYLDTDFLYTNSFLSKYKDAIKSIKDINYKDISIVDRDGNDNIDMKEEKCRFSIEYDNKIVYYNLYWGVNENYFLDDIIIEQDYTENIK